MQLQDELENLLVSNGDVIGLQHDAGPASLVRCQSSPHSLWRQPVFALGPSQWLWRGNAPASPHNSTREDSEPLPDPQLDVEAWVEEGRGRWLENVVCPVRVLYVGQSETRLQGPRLLAGLPQPGLYSLLVGPEFHLEQIFVFQLFRHLSSMTTFVLRKLFRTFSLQKLFRLL